MSSPAFSAHTSFDPSHDLYSDLMLLELLNTHEQLIVELRLKGPKGIIALNQSRDLIEQHEQTAARLRAHLKSLARIPLAATYPLAPVIQLQPYLT